MMPGMTGVHVLHHMRADPRLSAIPTPVLSATRAAGERDILRKASFTLDDLLSALNALA